MRNCKGSIPVGTRFSVGKSSVIPLLPADAGKGLASPSAVRTDSGWQSLFGGSRTGGFCTDKDEISICTAGKIRLTEKGSKGISSLVSPQRRSPFQRFFRFPLPWVIVVFPRWLMGLFRCLDSFSTSIKLTNCSIVMAS